LKSHRASYLQLALPSGFIYSPDPTTLIQGGTMHKAVIFIVLILFLLSGCGRLVVKPSNGAPPGQVQKATGFNPASGKIKSK
jgi:hypothetical protein